MSLFAVLAIDNKTKLKSVIMEKFSDNYYEITPSQWVVSAKGTAKKISDELGIGNEKSSIGEGVVFKVSGYWGLADKDLWEWIQAKEAEGDNG